jgi:hypothetical protein
MQYAFPLRAAPTDYYCASLMRFSSRKCAAFSACALLVLICSCDKHRVGEMPEVQRERVDLAGKSEKSSSAAEERSTSSSPKPTLTPAEFFRATKPR